MFKLEHPHHRCSGTIFVPQADQDLQQPSSGPSMYPTLGTSTKYILINKRHRLGRDLRVGDLIILQHPNFRNLRVGKRVLGLPGDFVVRDPHMSRTVGGMAVVAGASSSSTTEEPHMTEVPPGHVWVAGDNLAWSRDSRFYGPVPMGLVFGKVVRYSSPSSDWIVDMVRPEEDQLRPARMAVEGDADDDWTWTLRSFRGVKNAGVQKELDLKEVE